MNMDEKNKIITQYLYNTFLELKKLCSKDKGLFVNEDKYKRSLDLFLNRDEDIDVLIKMIDLEKEKLLDSYYKWEEQERQNFLDQFENETVENEKAGITLNRQMIELMMIVNSKSVDELINISSLLSINISNENIDLNQMKEQVFKTYIDSLTDRNEFYRNPSANLRQKILNVINNCDLTVEQIDRFKTIVQNGIQSNMSSSEIFKIIEVEFPKEVSHNIFVALSESRDLSEPGITDFQISDWQFLFDKLKEFKSITIDFEVKYPSIHLSNREFYYKKLERCLDFARFLHKDVRLNALIFFEDCPNFLSELEYNNENKQIVYNELLRYVDGITKMIASYNQMSLQKNGYEVVKSIDIFNELITRFSNDFMGEYFIREDVSKTNSQESGWQRFLSIEDLCQIALVARRNLPNVEFVYNEVNLEDKKKLPMFKSVLDRIRFFEEKHQDLLNDKKIIDCIGTQMHLKPYVTENDLDYSLDFLSSCGYPIKITEYDQTLSDDFINSHSSKECEAEKARRQEKLKNYFEVNAKKYNIKQVTIWSLTDSTNFLLDKKNKALIKNGMAPIKSIYGGAFRTKKVFDYRNTREVQIYKQIKQKNQYIKQKKSRNRSKDKPKVKKLSSFQNKNNGFANPLVILLIASFVAGALFMAMHLLWGDIL